MFQVICNKSVKAPSSFSWLTDASTASVIGVHVLTNETESRS